MANTEVDIANLALSRVRAGTIGSLLEQSPQAEQCRILYPNARDEVLSMTDWPFARFTLQLGLKTEKPAEWQYGYAYPNDCHVLRYLLPSADSVVNSINNVDDRFTEYEQNQYDFSVELNSDNELTIVTNLQEARAVYTKKVTDVRLYGSLVINLIAWRLASDLAIPLGGDAGGRYRSEARNEFNILKAQAEAVQMGQSRPRAKQQMPRAVAARTRRTSTNFRS